MNGLYVVVGASGAIGKQVCKNILQKGGTPVLVGRCYDKLKTLFNEEELCGKSVKIISEVDFMDPKVAGQKIASELKGETINGLVYSVGSITLKPIRGCNVDDFIDSYTLNVLGAIESIKATLPGLKKGSKVNNGSSIVLFSSIAARNGLANHSVIGCSKAAIEGLTVSLAAEFATFPIRVNCIAPSLTAGGSTMAKPLTDNQNIATAVAAAHPISRLGNPEDSASAATFLLSSESSSWTTGTIIPVDGGRSTILK